MAELLQSLYMKDEKNQEMFLGHIIEELRSRYHYNDIYPALERGFSFTVQRKCRSSAQAPPCPQAVPLVPLQAESRPHRGQGLCHLTS